MKYFFYILLLIVMQLPWQFAQFILLTQQIAVMATYWVILLLSHASSIPHLFATLARRLQDLVVCQLIALLLCYLLQFGNKLLFTSAYLPLLVGCFAGTDHI